MKAVYCDWCNKIYRKDEIKHLTLAGIYHRKILLMDICDKCIHQFETILDKISYIEVDDYCEDDDE